LALLDARRPQRVRDHRQPADARLRSRLQRDDAPLAQDLQWDDRMDSDSMTAALDAPAASANGFLALPFRPALAGEAITIERAKAISRILRGVASHESLFTDYERVCDARCFACPRCLARLARVSAMLTAPDARVWEVWRTDSSGESGLDVVGIL